MKTRKQLFQEVDEKIGSLAAEVVCKATAGERHWLRVEATVEAARKWVNEDHFHGEEEEKILIAAAIALDLGGVGGVGGVSGAGTDRYPAFWALGKGRKQASDGAAYMAAAEAALRHISDGRQLHVQLNPSGRVIVKFRHSETEVLFYCCGPLRWLRAEASRAALKAAGIEGFEPQLAWELEAIERALYECVQAEKDFQQEDWKRLAHEHAPEEWEAYASASDDDAAELAALNEKMVSLGFGYMPEGGVWP